MITLLLILWPLLGGILLYATRSNAPRQLALIFSLLQLGLTAYVLATFQHNAETQFLIQYPWVKSLGIYFKAGMDGISLVMVLLTNLLLPFIILSTDEKKYESAYAFYALMLIMQSALVGVFTALDAFLYYIFWEMALIPIYFILYLWGGENRARITVKFFLYTLAGSLFMLAGIIYLYVHTPEHSFDIDAFYKLNLDSDSQGWVFWAMFIAFAIKIPVFPFHSWQPQTYTMAPTAGTMLLSGIMLKMGLYSIIRWILPVVPSGVQHWGNFAMVLCIIGVIYGAWIAISQKNIKTLFAFSSMSHVGLIAAGIFSLNLQGIHGSVIQMFSHGINVVGLFFIAEILFRRLGSNQITDMGGIRLKAPAFSTAFIIILLGSVALPLTNGFIGEFMLLNGIYQYNAWYAAFAGLSVILGAVYMLKMYQHSMLGDKQAATASFSDISAGEKWILYPVCAFVIILGIYPQPLLEISEPAVKKLIEQMSDYTTYLN